MQSVYRASEDIGSTSTGDQQPVPRQLGTRFSEGPGRCRVHLSRCTNDERGMDSRVSNGFCRGHLPVPEVALHHLEARGYPLDSGGDDVHGRVARDVSSEADNDLRLDPRLHQVGRVEFACDEGLVINARPDRPVQAEATPEGLVREAELPSDGTPAGRDPFSFQVLTKAVTGLEGHGLDRPSSRCDHAPAKAGSGEVARQALCGVVHRQIRAERLVFHGIVFKQGGEECRRARAASIVTDANGKCAGTAASRSLALE